jgi:2-keto-4-pentenoate hydratase/2-oxohepta-3-ene-1,7-dioic acid hydratase in catechol pathway
MKLVRYGNPGQEKPGIVDGDGTIRDLSGVVPDINGAMLRAGGLEKIRATKAKSLPAAAAGTRIGPCVGDVRHFIAIGLNYADHAKEAGMPVPKEPIIFSKATSCIVGPNDNVVIPKSSQKCDWELELAVIIGRRASYVAANEALSYVAGYCVCNDVSEREWQQERGGQWIKGKSAPTFGPLGPWFVTADEIPDPQNLNMQLLLNGKRQQSGSTKTMIFGVEHLVSYLSHFMLLEPGDIITTGTPPGVGSGMKPPQFLKAGDTMELTIDGLGTQRQNVVAWSG